MWADVAGDEGFYNGTVASDGGGMGVDGQKGGENLQLPGWGGCFRSGRGFAGGEKNDEREKEIFFHKLTDGSMLWTATRPEAVP